MEYRKQDSKSLYDYSDKSVQQAAYAAIGYAIVGLFTGLLSWIQYFLYHRPGTGGILNRDFLSQQYLQHTPLTTALTVVFSIIIAAIAGTLAFFIFRRSAVAIITMLGFVVLLQLYTWLVAHSFSGSLISVIVSAFLLRGARRIYQDRRGQTELRKIP